MSVEVIGAVAAVVAAATGVFVIIMTIRFRRTTYVTPNVDWRGERMWQARAAAVSGSVELTPEAASFSLRSIRVWLRISESDWIECNTVLRDPDQQSFSKPVTIVIHARIPSNSAFLLGNPSEDIWGYAKVRLNIRGRTVGSTFTKRIRFLPSTRLSAPRGF